MIEQEEISVNPVLYRHQHTVLCNIERFAEFSITHNDELINGRSIASILRPFTDHVFSSNLNLDEGRSNLGEFWHDRCRHTLEYIQKWSLSQPKQTANQLFRNADFVSNRRTFKEIAYTLTCPRDDFDIVALRIGNIIYLDEYNSYKYSSSSYRGYKFDQFLTMKASVSNEDPTKNEPFNIMARSDLVTANGESIGLTYSAEIDAIDNFGRYVEMKTRSLRTPSGVCFSRSVRDWLQSKMVGIDELLIGHHDNGIVQKIEQVPLQHEYNRCQRTCDASLNFLATVLLKVKKRLFSQTGKYASCKLMFDKDGGRLWMDEARLDNPNETEILYPQFTHHLNMPITPFVIPHLNNNTHIDYNNNHTHSTYP